MSIVSPVFSDGIPAFYHLRRNFQPQSTGKNLRLLQGKHLFGNITGSTVSEGVILQAK
jgi:hypothetical protein